MHDTNARPKVNEISPNELEDEGKRYSPYKKFIGAVVPNWLMKRDDLTQGAKLCFGRLAQYAGKDECAFPGREALAKELGVSVPAVKGYLRELIGARLIESKRMGSGNFNVYYFLNLPGVVKFKTDGHSAIHQCSPSDGHSPSDGQEAAQLMDTKPSTDGYKTHSVFNVEENQGRESEENQKRITHSNSAKKEAAKQKELADALKHIASVAGPDTAEIMEKRKRSEVLELAGMSEEDIKKCRGLLNTGWTLARVKKYRILTPSAWWRRSFSEGELRIIDLYNTLCVPRGWRLVDADSKELHSALKRFECLDQDNGYFEGMFSEAASERDSDADSGYNARLGNKLLRILRRNL